MFKLVTLLFLIYAVCGGFSDPGNFIDKIAKTNRQKRLLFYDEEGNIVKTYTNPYLRKLPPNAENLPFFGSFLNPFFNVFRQSSLGFPTAYMIPVSDEIIQQIDHDPVYQNKLILSPAKDPVIEMNPMCKGRRTQIPSPKLCNNFLNCWDGWAFEQECPSGLLFSSDGYCDYPQKVDCNNRRLKEEVQPKCKKDFETFRSDMRCDEFFVCVNRSPIKFQCPADLSFNQDLGICDYSYRVNCSPSPEVSTTSKSPEQSATQAAVSSSAESGQPVTQPSNARTLITENTLYNSQGWSTHFAMSRQDAIRQLQLRRIAKVNAAY